VPLPSAAPPFPTEGSRRQAAPLPLPRQASWATSSSSPIDGSSRAGTGAAKKGRAGGGNQSGGGRIRRRNEVPWLPSSLPPPSAEEPRFRLGPVLALFYLLCYLAPISVTTSYEAPRLSSSDTQGTGWVAAVKQATSSPGVARSPPPRPHRAPDPGEDRGAAPGAPPRGRRRPVPRG
jgi:hypothetical protein